MYGKKPIKIPMDNSDILYIKDLLQNAKESRDWDEVDEAIETLKEFLDGDESPLEE
jgi:hypothetical protein